MVGKRKERRKWERHWREKNDHDGEPGREVERKKGDGGRERDVEPGRDGTKVET